MTTPTTPATDVKRYSVEENYSEVIEDGAVWVRASAYDALAAELDHARYTIEALRQQCKAEIELRDAATAEVGRLRAALRTIEKRWIGSRRHHDCGDYERGYGQAEADIGQFARTALAPSPTNSDGDNSEVK